ncbi:hypothetical protein [Snodgrassella alvi]|uniref:hypothetical protein n=1 Tax=Snodgrassella alvi TaxID=1196083 RepID=UPI0035133071
MRICLYEFYLAEWRVLFRFFCFKAGIKLVFMSVIKKTKLSSYKQAPLPFFGQKRNFLKPFSNVLNEHIEGLGDGWTIVDVFGGSGLLAHTAKRLKPHARVIYNDFDNYTYRLANIKDINRLRRQLSDIVKHIPLKSKLDADTKAKVINHLLSFDGYIDVASLQTWLLFSGGRANNLTELIKQTFYNRLLRDDYSLAIDYLDGIEITSKSFDLLLPEYIDNENTLLVLDPPYLFSDTRNYKNEENFRLTQFFKLVDTMRPPYILFSNAKSEILEYINYAADAQKEQFVNYSRISVKSPIGRGRVYEDYMIYKF